MASYTYINGDFAVLKTVLENSGFFDTVETGSFKTGSWTYPNSIICSVDGKNGFFKFGWWLHAGFNVSIYSLAVNQGSTPGYEFVPSYESGMQDDYFPVGVYVTSNGISIVCRRARILITRNQNGKVVVVTGANPAKSDSSTDYIMSAVCAISTDDNVERIVFPVNTAIGYQTMIQPLCTAAYNLSFTNKAGLLAYKQSNAIGNIRYGEKCYFTDGYFAIEDEEVMS
ncbi:MAG: hypothetical protein MJ065_08370 [Oscillospiraceae bacterium]|nr:hypothetical protein [Oscillospiraceae bacterium]